MICAKDAKALRNNDFVDLDRVLDSPRRLQGAGEVVTSGERVRMIWAQRAVLVAKYRFVQCDRCVEPSRGLVGACEIATGRKGVRVIDTKDPRGVGNEMLTEFNRASQVHGCDQLPRRPLSRGEGSFDSRGQVNPCSPASRPVGMDR